MRTISTRRHPEPAASALPHQSRYAELFAGFATPQPEFSPVPIWWWSGEPVTLPRLRWQLDQLVDQGVHNAVVLNLAPTGPLYGALADTPHLATEQWWQLWEGLCEHARDRGARLWFYDQIGFSGANLHGRLVTAEPTYAGASLTRVTVDVIDPAGKGTLTCPTGGTPVAGYAIPIDPSGRACGPPCPLDVTSGRLEWAGDGPCRLALVYSLRTGFDYTSPAACAALFDTMHGAFERRLGCYFGDVIVGSFQDELPSLPTWSPTFAAEFAARCGYRIEAVIAALWEDVPPDGGAGMTLDVEFARARTDYQRVRGVLAEEAFFRPLHAWHDRHGLTVGVDQQSPSRAGEPLGCTRQYADYPRTHRWYSAPGSDHWGDAKIHSSLAHHYGRPRTWIEAFHSTGWGGTLEETFDWLQPWLLAGATLYNPHAVYYSTRGGWWEWAPPSTCWRQPYWRHYRHFADTVSRLCWLLTRGDHACDIGVLFPAATVAAGTTQDGTLDSARAAHEVYLAVVGRMAWFNAAPGVLGADRRDFDVLDDDTVARAAIRDGVLATAGESYRAIVVPSCRVLETATAQRLVEFAEGGGRLVFVGDLPRHADRPGGDAAVTRLQELVGAGTALHTADAAGLAAVLAPIARDVVTDGPALHRRVGDHNVLVVTAAPAGSATAQPILPWACWQGDDLHIDYPRYNRDLREHGYDFDPARNRQSAVVHLPESAADVEQWDPLTGEATPLATTRGAGGVSATVSFVSAPVGVLVWRQADRADGTPAEAPAPAADPQVTSLDGPWRSRIEPTLDNRYGDFALPAVDGSLPVPQWRPRHRVESGNGGLAAGWHRPEHDDSDWSEVLATDGVWAWRYGPVDPDDLPAPASGSIGGPGWHPVRYSLSRGIATDPSHVAVLGPKARVPEEFWHVADVAEGQAVVLRTSVPSPSARQLTLAVGSNGSTQVWWNGVQLPDAAGGYHQLAAVSVHKGLNDLELRVWATEPGTLRGYWALTEDPEAFARPEWLTPADGSRPGSRITATTSFALAAPPHRAVAHLATEGAARLVVNGREIGTQGAFEPYLTNRQVRVLPYDLAPRLRVGDNTIEVTFADTGRAPAVLFDGLLEDADGTSTAVVSDASWTFCRDDGGERTIVGTALRRRQADDPRWALLRARPHPLPRTGWLAADQPDSGVVDLVPDAYAGSSRPAEWFRLVVPPGATEATLPVTGDVTVWLNGAEVAITGDQIELAEPAAVRRMLVLRVCPTDGRNGGALWDGPAEFRCADGVIVAGPWADQGLGSYAGAVTYTRDVTVPDRSARVVLDLGAVRGTAEVEVNGEPVGVRIWSPYRFDITAYVRPGANTVAVTVTNTLGPYLADASPTAGVYAGQRLSGLLGPVRLLVTPAADSPASTVEQP